MAIIFHEKSQTFHLFNDQVSYIFKILSNKQLGQLYYGAAVTDRDSFDHLLIQRACILAPGTFQGNLDFSLETIRQEYPAYGTGDYREPAYQLQVSDGSRITDFQYHSYKIYTGKMEIEGLPHTYGTQKEVESLEILMKDSMTECTLQLNYHLFYESGAIVRSVKFENHGNETQKISRVMSTSIDLELANYEMLQLDGAWSRERHITTRKIEKGIQSVGSLRGASSPNHNPFLCLKAENTTEYTGDAYGFSLIYSGNFLAQVERDSYDITRVMMGIHPFDFEWTLMPGECFQSPEAVMIYSKSGLNGMSQSFHKLFKQNLMRGVWKDKVRPILINNWEATYFDFDETKILKIAKKAKELGMELFVLDDGWFGKRNNDSTSLGDWTENLSKLPTGISGLSRKITEMGLKFGLWFEPEMVNEISNLYEQHPDWVIGVPGRHKSYGRNQFVLDFSRDDVVDYIFEKMKTILDESEISYIKWDMNRNITEAYSLKLSMDRQQEFFHRYILGVYQLYERLIKEFPEILFESCASGGGRFDPGMLFYAPQAWTSDDTDAVERLHIQNGTSMLYPIVSMGTHVAAIPNHQVSRKTNLKMRGDVAYFGTFGYELDITKITEEEEQQIKKQIQFFKENRELIQFGDFYRIETENDNYYGWMVVSKDKREVIFAYYKILATPNPGLKRFRLTGLDPKFCYFCEERNQQFYGDELMNIGLSAEVEFTGLIQPENFKGIYHSGTDHGDFTSHIYKMKALI